MGIAERTRTAGGSSAAAAGGRVEARWETRGFEAFRRGSFGNAGHNLWVSRAGILQRIHQYDLNRDGHVELLFCNSQEHLETAPAYLYRWAEDAFAREELPTHGAGCATVADLNRDGCPELIIGNWYDGVTFDLNAIIYYGQGGHWGEQAVQYLPAPQCTAAAAGDFNGDGRVDLALQCGPKLRLFYQSEHGIEPQLAVELAVSGDQLAAHDLDGDGCAELIVRFKNGAVRVYWGDSGGIDAERFTEIAAAPEGTAGAGPEQTPASAEWVNAPQPRVQVILLRGRPHVFVSRPEAAMFYPVSSNRTIGQPLRIDVPQIYAVAAADLDGDGHEDLVLAGRDESGQSDASWICWGGADGFSQARRTILPQSAGACDVTAGDFDGDGRLEVALCRGFRNDTFTTPALVYRIADRQAVVWREVEAHDARRVIAVPGKGGGPDLLFVLNRQGRNKRGDIDAAIYLGGPDGFRADRRLLLPGWGATVAVCADFNDDGWPDLAMANTSENSVEEDPGSYLYLNGPGGFGQRPATVLPTTRAHGIACADLDHDGYLDLVFGGFNNDEILVFRGLPDGGFDTANPQRIKLELDGITYKEVRFLNLADLNGDGWLDLIVPLIDSDYSLVLWGGPDGFSMKRCRKFNVRHACCARAADLDGDGYLDLIFGGHLASPTGPHDSFAYIYWNGPDGLREDRRTLLPAEGVNSISVGDFNNDGNLDLFLGSYHDGRKRRDIDSYLYWNRGGRGFSASDFNRLFNHSASGDFAADFNEDGWLDLAVANHKYYGDHRGRSIVWWNGPAGFSEERTTLLPTSGPHGMVCPGPGNVMDRGPEEYYTSEPHELGAGRRIARIEWEAKLAPKTWVRAQLRVAATREALEDADWLGSQGPGSWCENGEGLPEALSSGRWVQYRLALGATNSGGTPRIASVAVEFAE